MKLKQDLTLKDFEIVRTPDYVTWDDCEKVLGKRRYKKLNKWMRGQTCSLNGIYTGDLNRFLKGLPVID